AAVVAFGQMINVDDRTHSVLLFRPKDPRIRRAGWTATAGRCNGKTFWPDPASASRANAARLGQQAIAGAFNTGLKRLHHLVGTGTSRQRRQEFDHRGTATDRNTALGPEQATVHRNRMDRQAGG